MTTPTPVHVSIDTAPLARHFGQLVYHARKARRMTQLALADAVGCTQPHITNLEKGRVDPDLSLVGRLMEVLDIEARLVFARTSRRKRAA